LLLRRAEPLASEPLARTGGELLGRLLSPRQARRVALRLRCKHGLGACLQRGARLAGGGAGAGEGEGDRDTHVALMRTILRNQAAIIQALRRQKAEMDAMYAAAAGRQPPAVPEPEPGGAGQGEETTDR